MCHVRNFCSSDTKMHRDGACVLRDANIMLPPLLIRSHAAHVTKEKNHACLIMYRSERAQQIVTLLPNRSLNWEKPELLGTLKNKNEKQKRDVPAEFRSDEWKLLHHWQQDLYKNVMKEIQQAFNSLGPLIANSVFSLRPNEKEDLCSVDHEDLETKGRTNLSTTDVAVDSDVLLKKTGNDNEYLKNSLDTHCKGRRDGPGTGYQFADTVNIVRIEEELGSSIADHYCAEKQERNSRPNLVSVAAGPAVASFRIKSEGEPFSADQLYCDRRENIVGTRFPFLTTDVQASLSNIQDTQREESSFCISSGHEGTTVGINEVGELYPLNIKDCERRENIHSALGDGSMGIQKEVAESIQSTKTTSSYLPPLKEKQTEIVTEAFHGKVILIIIEENTINPNIALDNGGGEEL
ncbi:hypothetical protein NDU88_001539 [Pleurodeles waltl]|uniref:KRAB domain-containing protein n=1 Tax=Pleurodeles waltl TaxID=8319 RepID=A0AAV7SB46_PLEWA|nr:hypothetical protein NDU88_001539 [Pleurodeles waltl]